VDGSTGYVHPGKLFIERYGRATEGSALIRYAQFLREESGLSDEPPVDLVAIFNRFGIALPKRVRLPGQSGLLANPERGLIFISSDDPTTRQRFSEAHELMELLFAAQSPVSSGSDRGRKLFSDKAKERLCDEGAAELLMPASTFVPHVDEQDVSIETGQRLSALYRVSLMAALVRAVRFGSGQYALVLWKLGWKPSEQKSLPNPDQLLLFPDYTPQPPPRRPRVLWGYSKKGVPFIPRNKSVGFETSIYESYELGSSRKGTDWLDLGTFCGYCFCDSMPMTLQGERCVLSVLRLPNNDAGESGFRQQRLRCP